MLNIQSFMKSNPVKNLSSHPAFASNRPTSAGTDVPFEELFDEIDAGLDQAIGVERVNKLLDRIASDVAPDFLPFLKLGCEKAIRRNAREQELQALHFTDFSAPEHIRKQAEILAEAGVLRATMPSVQLDTLTSMLAPAIAELRVKASEKPDSVLTREIPESGPNELMHTFCRENHILDILSQLYGIEFERVGFSLHYSYPRETWYRLFDDLNLPPPRTTQMHYDLEYAIPKAMLYLNDVGLTQGPFSYCSQSPKWKNAGIRLCLYKEIDYCIRDFVLASGKSTPEEPILRSQFARNLLAALPAPLRGTAMPGNFILDDTPESEALLASETIVTGPAGSFTLFTGGHILHRGGLVQEGERIVLQIGFWPKDESHYKPSVTLPPRKGRFFSNEDFSRKLVNISPQRDLIALDIGGAVEMQPHWLRLPKVAKTYVFEPHSESFLDLLERQKIDPTYAYNHYLMIALGGENGFRTLYKANEPTGSSLLPPHPHGINNYPESEYLYPMEQETIEVQTLASALELFNLSHVDAIKLDTQGTEFEILKGLGPELSRDLLLVEMEIPIIENYEGNATNLPDVIRYCKRLELDLFDLRCNRFPGNAIRLGKDFTTRTLDAEWGLPSMGERLNEVDAVFFKDPRKLIDEGCSQEKLRRLISLLALYYFFPEAVFAAEYGYGKDKLTLEEKDSIVQTLRELHAMARNQTRVYERHLKERDGMNWGQYMHVKSPST
jgi:FkbM family methyltransferase